MTLIESIGLGVAKKLTVALLKAGYNHLFASNSNKFEQELSRIIDLSAEEYGNRHPYVGEKISFCQSQTFINQLLLFRFTTSLDYEVIKKAIGEDGRIQIPSEDEIRDFMDIFDKNIQASSEIKQSSIEYTYKEEIFRISERLKLIESAVTLAIEELKD